MEESKLIDLSGFQAAAIAAAFEDHKKMPRLPTHLKALTKYDVRLESDTKTYTVMFSQVTPKGQVNIHQPFSGGYILDKGSLKILKRFIVG